MQRISIILGLLIFSLISPKLSFGQNDKVKMHVLLDADTNTIHIEQDLVYYNNSPDTLHQVYFHDWPNSYSNKNTVLGKRFIENYSKKFFFTSEKNRGFTKIHNIVIDYKSIEWNRKKEIDDYFTVPLQNNLLPGDSISIKLNYSVKIPNAKFTDYGVHKENFNLRYWYLIPVVYNNGWQLMHNLDMNDLYQNPTDFSITLKIPNEYEVISNLCEKKIGEKYLLSGNNIQDVKLIITKNNNYHNFDTDDIIITTNLNNIELEKKIKQDILNRQLAFLKEKLGNYSHHKILISNFEYSKNPLYGINQLPNFLRPFSDTFEWDMRMFKVLSETYISNNLQTHTRKDSWLQDGLQSYLMMLYVEEYYKEINLIGNLSKFWGLRTYHIADLSFNDRYNFAYQYTANKNRDQALSTRTDSLTNFNRLILNRYKTALGLRYLDDYLGENIIQEAIKDYFNKTSSDKNDVSIFQEYINTHTDKDTDWFFNEYLTTNNKIDYKLKCIRHFGDSLELNVKNIKKSSAPIALYAVKNDSIISKQWITHVDSIQTFKVKNNNATRWILNYEEKVPEIKMHNNWQKNKSTLFRQPLKVKWIKDVDDPYHNQLFVEPQVNYNYYDGFMIASKFSNQTLQRKEFEYKLIPSYGIKSNSLTGFFRANFIKYTKGKKINKYRIGLDGKYFHYEKELGYSKITPYVELVFKPKNLRSVASSNIFSSYTMVNREVDSLYSSSDKYKILNVAYNYNNPALINNFKFSSNIEFSSKFSKLNMDFRYRKLTNSNRQFEVRLFTGAFLYNNTESDFFSYGVNRPNDYLFRYEYYGAAETNGFFSQQIIINDGGFKSDMPVRFANQWISSINTSIGIWRWFEIYNDVGFAKNRGEPVYFLHDKGFRLNFVHNIFEIYFPMHSSNGWEISQPHYEEKIRFVFTANFKKIYSFMQRGFM